MKLSRLFLAALVAAVTTTSLVAQTKPATQGAPPTAAAPNVPATKVALINTEMFADEKQGILRIVAAVKKIDGEFQPRRTELQQLQTRVQTLSDDIEKTKNVAAPAALQQKMDQLDQLKKEGQRKQEDAQAAYNKRMQEILAPIYEDI